MQIIEVDNQQKEAIFIEINYWINKHNPHYIRPLDNEVKDVFNIQKNKFYKNGGKVRRWIVEKNNRYIGRIAAFTYPKYINKGTKFPVGCVGFFDSIDDQDVANLLFNTSLNWLKKQGCEAMDGPVNFGDRDKWWGLLVEGFEQEPIYGLAFNPPYYQQLFETYGFQNYYYQYYFGLDVSVKLADKFAERHARFKNKDGYEARHISKKNLQQHAEEFAKVYNAAWAQHEGGKEIKPSQVMKTFNMLKPILDERLIWFAYYKNEPIAMWINIPDLNQYFKHFNGKLGLWQKIKLLYLKYTGKCKKFIGVAFGIVPQYQGLGIDSFMIYEGAQLIQNKTHYKQFEMGWTGDWNPRMISIYHSLGAEQSRTLITYRYIFDNKHPFTRHPSINITKTDKKKQV